jgi:hypothetical protein
MVRLVDGHVHDKNATKSALAWLATIDPKYRSEWPREVANRAMRVGPVVQFVKSSQPSNAITKASQKAIETAGPLSKDEARAKLFDVVCKLDEHSYEFKVAEYVYLIETVIGADAALDAIAEGFEKSKPQVVKPGAGTPMESYIKKYVAGTIGFLLLRAKKSAPLRKRLEAQHARFATIAKKSDDWEWCALTFDRALNGSAAFKRQLAAGWKTSLAYLDHVNDDPDLVRDCVKKEPKQSMSVRLAKLGGAGVLEGLVKRKFSSPELVAALRDFGMVKSPEVVELALSLVGKSALKDAPLEWLVAHADYAKPIVQRSKTTTAKAVLARLPT